MVIFQPSPSFFFVAVNRKLFFASRNGDIDAMKEALAEGADVEYREMEDIYGEFIYGTSTCLLMAARHGHLEATKLLLEEGANIDAVTGIELYTPMMMASGKNKPEMVRLLLEHNGNTNLKDKHGWTALHHAAWNGNLSVVQVLVGKSNVNARDYAGKTPLDKAERRFYEEISGKDYAMMV